MGSDNRAKVNVATAIRYDTQSPVRELGVRFGSRSEIGSVYAERQFLDIEGDGCIVRRAVAGGTSSCASEVQGQFDAGLRFIWVGVMEDNMWEHQRLSFAQVVDAAGWMHTPMPSLRSGRAATVPSSVPRPCRKGASGEYGKWRLRSGPARAPTGGVTRPIGDQRRLEVTPVSRKPKGGWLPPV
jgi:hypothetical protein